MKNTLCRSCFVTLAVLFLPGCMAINAVLGVIGFMTTGPLQYAGTAYSVGEYTYEYAVNDKTPDEVIEEKFVWLFGPDEETLLASAPLAMEKTPPDSGKIVQPVTTSLVNASGVTLTPDTPRHAAPLMVASIPPRTVPTALAKPIPAAPASRIQSTRQVKTVVQAAASRRELSTPTAPHHTYVKRTADPLLEKLTRLEQALNQAETILTQEPAQGVRYSVSVDENGQAGTGVSGSWSIRHGLMESSPAPDMAVETIPLIATNHIS